MKIIAVDISPFMDDDRLVAENIKNEMEGMTMVNSLNRSTHNYKNLQHDPFLEYRLVDDEYRLKKNSNGG